MQAFVQNYSQVSGLVKMLKRPTKVVPEYWSRYVGWSCGVLSYSFSLHDVRRVQPRVLDPYLFRRCAIV